MVQVSMYENGCVFNDFKFYDKKSIFVIKQITNKDKNKWILFQWICKTEEIEIKDIKIKVISQKINYV